MRVYLEEGKTWTFACAVDWPGWCRRGKGEQAAIEELLAYADRYRLVAGKGFDPGPPKVIGRLPGNTTTDFGAPDVRGPWDDEPLTPEEIHLLERCWAVCDDVVATASAELRKGPRGGGRDRDQIVAHICNAERAYGRKVGAQVPPRTPWPDQRVALLEALRNLGTTSWPAKYAVRRMAWHVLDHAWEIEDKTLPAGS